MQNINTVAITGNLTRDPEMRQAGSTTVCSLRVAVNGRVKRGDQWEDKPNYFDVTVFGSQGENCGKYLAKGRGVAIQGRLDWREWETDGQKRQAVQIIADNVQFLSDGSGGGGSTNRSQAESDIPVDTSDFVGAGAAASPDDDIPF